MITNKGLSGLANPPLALSERGIGAENHTSSPVRYDPACNRDMISSFTVLLVAKAAAKKFESVGYVSCCIISFSRLNILDVAFIFRKLSSGMP